ncbi:MAG: sigma-70 family RNA polymerase sigma factor [Rhodospirillales bacterium]|nr:sigma-70 family RNA polymerase sigma factor [Acetobacter sp.]
MDDASTHDVTRLLHAWSDGDPLASEQLLPIIYDHLRRLAREQMRHERSGHTLQPTALVHEVYLRLTDGTSVQYRSRVHFLSLAARAMRRILIDHARASQAQRRGGGARHVSLSKTPTVAQSESDDRETVLVELDEALGRLGKEHPRMGQVVELRFFGEMEMADIAEALRVAERTVKRDWQFAKLWLHRELGLGRAEF